MQLLEQEIEQEEDRDSGGKVLPVPGDDGSEGRRGGSQSCVLLQQRG